MNSLKGFFEFLAAPGDACAIGGRHIQRRGGTTQRFNAVSESVSRGNPPTHAHGALLIHAVDTRGRLRRHDPDQIVEPHQATALAGHIEPPDGVRIVAVSITDTQLHVIVLVERSDHGSVTLCLPRRP